MSDKVQVLVATMNQKDFSLLDRMNLHCNAIIANQADYEADETMKVESGTVRMITTKTRGVGINRNIALEASDHEILLMADDDMRYNDDMEEQVEKAFIDCPDADVIVFSVEYSKNGVITGRRQLETKRLHLWNSLRYGTYVLACRRESVIKAGIKFSTEFGGGTIYGSGEDSWFIKDCYDACLRFYSDDYVLGVCAKDTSSWFTGCNEKYFFDKGALMGKMFPRLKFLMVLYFSARVKKSTDIPFGKRYQLMRAGMRAGRLSITYDEYESRLNEVEKNHHRQ